MGPSGFLATHMPWRKKKQLLQLPLEKMTVKGTKPCKGVQVAVKEPRSLRLVLSRKAVASPHVAASQAPDPACPGEEKRITEGGRECTVCLRHVNAHTPTHRHIPVPSPCLAFHGQGTR